MRLVLSLAACALAGCNLVLGLGEPTAGRDAEVGDATDATDPDRDADGDAPDAATPSISAVVAGREHTCILRGAGVRCWGRGTTGQLGYGNPFNLGDDEAPEVGGDVAIGAGIPIQLAAGNDHTCVLFDTGAVKCWGLGVGGRLGTGSTASIGDDEVPTAIDTVDVGGISTMVAAGGGHTCVTTSGHVRCWGAGLNGRLGYGNSADVGDNEPPSAAGDVPSVSSVFAVATGGAHTCVLFSAGSIACWGLGLSGQLGYASNADIGDNETVSATVSLSGPATQVVTGDAHTCALLNGGQVQCWGDGSHGALGYGNVLSIGDNELPVSAGTVVVGFVAVQLAAGAAHTCALSAQGAVRCWGYNNHGQLGYGNTNNIGDNETPSIAGDVQLGADAVAITAGGDHTCALLETKQVRCWGGGASGALGLGTTDDIGDNELPISVSPIGP